MWNLKGRKNSELLSFHKFNSLFLWDDKSKKMNTIEKLSYIQSNHFGEWLKTRQEVENEISDKQSIFCLCGRLATGLHERSCRKFQNKIINETVKKLAHLIIN